MIGKVIGALVLVGLFGYWFAFHSGFIPFSLNPMQYMPNMHRGPALKPQRASPITPSGSSALVPPAGSIARGAHPYPYSKDTLASDVLAKANPLPKSREVLARGKKMYETHCIVCHGSLGMGDGTVVGPYPKPPILVSEKLENYADSQIFHVITRGQNIMYPYGHKVRVEDRWAIIHYVRALQLAYNPSPEDMSLFKEMVGKPKESK